MGSSIRDATRRKTDNVGGVENPMGGTTITRTGQESKRKSSAGGGSSTEMKRGLETTEKRGRNTDRTVRNRRRAEGWKEAIPDSTSKRGDGKELGSCLEILEAGGKRSKRSMDTRMEAQGAKHM